MARRSSPHSARVPSAAERAGGWASPRSLNRMSYVHGYHERESERLHDQAGSLVELLARRHLLSARRAGAGGRVRRRSADGDAVRAQPRRALHVDRPLRRVLGRGRAAVRGPGNNVEFRQADIFDLPFAPASFDHVFVCFVLEHLARAGRGARAAEGRAQTGRDDHRDRGRPRVGLLSPRQRRGPRRDPVPGHAAARRRRQLADRPSGLSAARAGAASRTYASRRGWSTSTTAGPSSWTASRARRSRR